MMVGERWNWIQSEDKSDFYRCPTLLQGAMIGEESALTPSDVCGEGTALSLDGIKLDLDDLPR